MSRHLLWTGGWDSTFRLFELALVHDAPVQTHYLVDPGRRSSSKELEVIDTILEELAKRGVDAVPPRVTRISEIPTRDVTTKQLTELRKEAPIGVQYAWLADYAHSIGATLELSVHEDDRATKFLKGFVRQVDDEAGGSWELQEDAPERLEFFRAFRFPVFRLTKLEMLRRAEQHGFQDLMELTWFCHSPIAGRPCGRCLPCQFAVEEGLGRRLPFPSRALATLASLRRRTLARVRESS